MRKLVLLGLMLATTLPAMAARRVTVEELKQFVVAQQAASKSDSDIAREVSTLELTEELTDPTLNRIATELKPGPKTAAALNLLADTSVFLDPPASELPATAKPDPAAQRAMLNGAMGFVAGTLRHLPIFWPRARLAPSTTARLSLGTVVLRRMLISIWSEASIGISLIAAAKR